LVHVKYLNDYNFNQVFTLKNTESITAYVILMCWKKNSEEVPEDVVDKRRNAYEFKSD